MKNPYKLDQKELNEVIKKLIENDEIGIAVSKSLSAAKKDYELFGLPIYLEEISKLEEAHEVWYNMGAKLRLHYEGK